MARAGVFAAIVAGVILMVAVVAIATLHRLARQACTDQLGEDMQYMALAAAAQIDPAAHARIRDRSQQNSAEYDDVVEPLRKILRTAPCVKDLYTFTVETGDVRFVMDAARPGDHDGDGRDDQAKIGEVHHEVNDAILRCIATGLPTVTSDSYPNDRPADSGVFYSAYVPVRAHSGTVSFYLGLDVSAEVHDARLAALDRAALLAAAPAAAVALGVGMASWALIYSRSKARRSLQLAARDAKANADRIAAMNLELRKAVLAAESGERTKAAFIANLSHEIRTPMTAVLGYVDLMTDPAATPKTRAEYAATIRRAGNHLLAVINDILDMSKIEAGKMSVERIPTSPAEVLTDVADMLEAKARAKGLGFRTRIDTSVPGSVLSDPTRIRQILVNLVSNAIKFTETGQITISAMHRAEDARLIVSVSDTGIGMTPDQVGTLFRPFSQADASTTRKFGGTGLGLTISKRLAEAMGGTILVSSELGRGSTFVVELPADPTEEKRSSPAIGASALVGVRVLLAEDNPDNQRLIRFHLEHAGAVVHLVDNGVAAVDAATRDDGFGVILMDMHMPGMDGCDAARAIRKRGIRTPILAVTANDGADERQACLDAGCDDFATKPVNPERLVATIRTLARRRAAQATARPARKA